MARKEEIEILKAYREKLFNSASNQLDKDIKAFDAAINSLEIDERYELEYERIEPCEDCISRADARHLIAEVNRKTLGCISTKAFNTLYNGIDELSPVMPQPKMGHWIVNEWGNISCSECGCTALYDKVYPGESVFGKAVRVKSTFCPTCGAKMQEE